MSMHLYYTPLMSPSTSKAQRELRLLCGYEDGGVVLRRRTTPQDIQTVEGKGWDVIWKSRLHVESGSSSRAIVHHRRCLLIHVGSSDGHGGIQGL